MTECLPVADIDLVSLESLGPGALHHLGVCVGSPVDGVELLIDPLDELGVPTGRPTTEPGVLGEVRVRAAHQRLGYDRLWHTTHLASPADGWHATGDVGAVDTDGRLWIGGRTGHVIRTATGPVAPTPIERAVDMLDGIRRSAAVGVGPAGAQVVVVIAETSDVGRRPRQSSLDRIDRIRAAVTEATGLDVAACLEVRRFRSIVATTPRSTAPISPTGRPVCSRADRFATHEGARHRRHQPARPSHGRPAARRRPRRRRVATHALRS